MRALIRDSAPPMVLVIWAFLRMCSRILPPQARLLKMVRLAGADIRDAAENLLKVAAQVFIAVDASRRQRLKPYD